MSVALCIGSIQQCDTTMIHATASRSCSSLMVQPAISVAEDLQHHMLTADMVLMAGRFCLGMIKKR